MASIIHRAEKRHKTRTALAWLLSASVVVACQDSVVDQSADTVLINGKIYQGEGPPAEAIALRDGQILDIGPSAHIRSLADKSTEIFDLNGRLVLPGLHDSHLHVFGLVKPGGCDLNATPMPLDTLVATLRECLAQLDLAPDDWFVIDQWSFSIGNQPSPEYPTLRAALDAVSTDHRIFLRGDDGHHAGVNSLALSQAKTSDGDTVAVNAETLRTVYADVASLVHQDWRNEPDGVLAEAARKIVNPPALWSFNRGDESTARNVMQVLASRGITAVQGAAFNPDMLPVFAALENAGEMTVHLQTAILPDLSAYPKDSAAIDSIVKELSALRSAFATSELIEVDTVKVFLDGVLEAAIYATPPTLPNAAVLTNYRQPIFGFDQTNGDPHIVGTVDVDSEACKSARSRDFDDHSRQAYFDDNGYWPQQCMQSKGILELDPGFAKDYFLALDKAGFNIHAHSIGDRAVRVALDSFEHVRNSSTNSELAHSIAHMQLVHPDDVPRFRELDLFAMFTFSWGSPYFVYDMTVAPFVAEVTSRHDIYADNYFFNNAYPAGTLHRSGAKLIAGSDAPVGVRDPIPFQNIEIAVTRSNFLGETLNANQTISIHDAIAAYTINGATAMGHARDRGSLEAGKRADLIVLDQDIVSLAENERASEIGDTNVILTMFGGNIIFRDTGDMP